VTKGLRSECLAVVCDLLFEILCLSANKYTRQRLRQGSEIRDPNLESETALLLLEPIEVASADAR